VCAVELGGRRRAAMWGAGPGGGGWGGRRARAGGGGTVEIWGPGGSYVKQDWKEEFVDDASQRIAKLQQDTGIKADIFIGSGDVPKVLSQVAKQTNADLLVTGCNPYGSHLRTDGYAIICAVGIPVLNV